MKRGQRRALQGGLSCSTSLAGSRAPWLISGTRGRKMRGEFVAVGPRNLSLTCQGRGTSIQLRYLLSQHSYLLQPRIYSRCCQEKLWMPWKCSRPGWSDLVCGRCPCPWQGEKEMIFNYSRVIFYGFVIFGHEGPGWMVVTVLNLDPWLHPMWPWPSEKGHGQEHRVTG